MTPEEVNLQSWPDEPRTLTMKDREAINKINQLPPNNPPMGTWDITYACGNCNQMAEILSMIENAFADVGFKAEYALLHPENMTKNEKEMAETLTRIYQIAHGFNQSNPCWSSHENWREEAERK